MKIMLFLICFIILSGVAFSQYLEPNDIEIYLNGLELYYSVTFLQGSNYELTEYLYRNNNGRLDHEFNRLISFYDNTNATFSTFQQYFQDIVNYNVTISWMENLYNEMGWQNNGGLKIAMIRMIRDYISRKNYLEVDVERIEFIGIRYNLFLELQTLFHPQDYELVRVNFNRIISRENEVGAKFGDGF